LNCDKIYEFNCTIKNINKFNKFKKLYYYLKVYNQLVNIKYRKIKKYFHPDNIIQYYDENKGLNENLLKY
jgi:hypothetical protein